MGKRIDGVSCCICGRTNTSFNKTKLGYMCQKHSHQLYEKGEITDPSPFSCQTDTNEYIEHEDYYEIVLRKCTSGYPIVGYAIIDKDDYERCKNYRWRMVKWTYKNKKERYVVTTGSPTKNNMVDLHRFIMGIPKDKVVDHINGNTLDNRKSNLRICRQKDNVRNKTQIQSNNSSGITGVYADTRPRNTNWIAEIKFEDIKIYLSAYKTIDEAVYCRYIAEQILFGEFRPYSNDEVIKRYINNKNIDKHSIEEKVKSRIKAKIPIDKLNSLNINLDNYKVEITD